MASPQSNPSVLPWYTPAIQPLGPQIPNQLNCRECSIPLLALVSNLSELQHTQGYTEICHTSGRCETHSTMSSSSNLLRPRHFHCSARKLLRLHYITSITLTTEHRMGHPHHFQIAVEEVVFSEANQRQCIPRVQFVCFDDLFVTFSDLRIPSQHSIKPANGPTRPLLISITPNWHRVSTLLGSRSSTCDRPDSNMAALEGS